MSGGIYPKRKKNAYPVDYSFYDSQRKQIQSPTIEIPANSPISYDTAFPDEANVTQSSLGSISDAGAASGSFEEEIGVISELCILRHVTFSSCIFAGTPTVQGRSRLGIQRAGVAVDIYSINHFHGNAGVPQCSTDTPAITLKPGDRIYFNHFRNGNGTKFQCFGQVVATRI